jgi:hypothetical protein
MDPSNEVVFDCSLSEMNQRCPEPYLFLNLTAAPHLSRKIGIRVYIYMANTVDKCSGGALGPLETLKQRVKDRAEALTGGRGFKEAIESAKVSARERALLARRAANRRVAGGPECDYSHVYRQESHTHHIRSFIHS